AIDGTAGSGKSTIAKGAAKELNWLYLDTGAMYRAITYKIITEKLDYQNEQLLKEMLEQTEIDFRYHSDEAVYQIYLDGKNVTRVIRNPLVDKLVSHVSLIPIVREKMVKEQRKIAQGKNTICEGRDIGSVVFPNADLKFFVDCDLDERALRRKKELGESISYEEIRNNLIERDYIDSNREISPLKREKDAIYLDTTNLKINEEIAIVVLLIKMRLLTQNSFI
ncbi:MAG: (d)CMP kinase, partial [candidate division WOR-3 bacterium]|nr:(d)CMP kinase [candidate division WOR-3 bacterium]